MRGFNARYSLRLAVAKLIVGGDVDRRLGLQIMPTGIRVRGWPGPQQRDLLTSPMETGR